MRAHVGYDPVSFAGSLLGSTRKTHPVAQRTAGLEVGFTPDPVGWFERFIVNRNNPVKAAKTDDPGECRISGRHRDAWFSGLDVGLGRQPSIRPTD